MSSTSARSIRLGLFAAAPERIARLLATAAMVGLAVVVITGLGIKDAAGGLGTPLPPFLMAWRPALHPLALVSVAVLAAAVLVAPALVGRVRSRLAVGVGLYALALVLGLALNVARAGTGGWWAVFASGPHGSFESSFEYLPALPLLEHGTGYYLRHFASLFPYMTTHVKGNPPGPLIALHLLGIRSPHALAAVCVGVGALSAPLVYDLGCGLGGEQRGRLAGLLSAFSPALLLFGVTSVDYVFVTFGLLGACLLARRGTAALLAGSIAVAIASFFSWLLLAIGAWAALLALQRDGRRRAVAICLAVGLAVAGFNALLALRYGYDPFEALRATAHAYHQGVAREPAVCVLARRLAGRLGAHARAANHLARAALARTERSGWHRNLGARPDLLAARAHEGRDRADLAAVRAVRVRRRRRGDDLAAAAAIAQRARGASVGARDAVLHHVVRSRSRIATVGVCRFS